MRCEANTRRDRRRSSQLPARLRSLCSAMQKIPARSDRNDLLIPPGQLEQAARTIWHARPVSYYAWSGHEHHANSTETARAMAMLYALTGSFDAAGGNVLFPAVPAGSITGEDLPAAKRLAPAIGFAERPLGPARWNHVSPQDFYRAVLEDTPYPVRGLIGFGANLLLAHGDPVRGRAALVALDFYAHADLFMTPTAALADIVLPVASCFEREALEIEFEISAEAQSRVQLRQAIVAPPARHGRTPISSSTSLRVSALASISGTVMSMPVIGSSLVRAASA